MANFIRCPNCQTKNYDTALNCEKCGKALKPGVEDKFTGSATSAKTQIPDSIKKFLTDEQDPTQVQQAHGKVQQILTPGEEINYIAVQKPLMSLSPDCIVLTNKRFIIYRPTILGGANFQDYIWRDLHDAHLKEGMLTATLTMKALNNQALQIDNLPKAQARKLYSYAQQMEEHVREERRTREMEEKRAAAGGIYLQGAIPQMPVAPTAPPAPGPAPALQPDPMEQLQKLKAMFAAELITEKEYEAKKAEILSRL